MNTMSENSTRRNRMLHTDPCDNRGASEQWTHMSEEMNGIRRKQHRLVAQQSQDAIAHNVLSHMSVNRGQGVIQQVDVGTCICEYT